MSDQTKLLSATPATTTIGTGEYLAKVDANGQVTRISLADLRAAVLDGMESVWGGVIINEFQNGILLDLEISELAAAMLTIHIIGNSYAEAEKPFDSIVQFYFHRDSDKFIQPSMVNNGASFGNVKVFMYQGRYHMWFAQPRRFCTFIIRAWSSWMITGPVKITARNEAMPTSGVTKEITIIPKNN